MKRLLTLCRKRGARVCGMVAAMAMSLGTNAQELLPITVNGVTFNMVYVEGGSFQMGAGPEQEVYLRKGYKKLERPVHSVTLSSYYIGEAEVTQELWEAVMGSNPSRWKGSDLPVHQVTWTECNAFLKKLSEITGRTYRFPTEAEWEYAARGGKKSMGYVYSGGDHLDLVAWHEVNSQEYDGHWVCPIPHGVKTKQPNELGIYDMSGNVEEWCSDEVLRSYKKSPQVNPIGKAKTDVHATRGGSCEDSDNKFGNKFRVSSRCWALTSKTYGCIGLRVVLVP